MEMFNEELTAQLKKMMIDHENEKRATMNGGRVRMILNI